MPASLATVVRLLLVLALVFNGWAMPMHAHAAVASTAESSAPTAPGSDCHEEGKLLAGSEAPADADCCDSGRCTSCSCMVACASALPVAGPGGSRWGTAAAPRAGPSNAAGVRPSANLLRPPIA